MTAIILPMPDRNHQLLCHIETGELLAAGEESLNELADQARAILTRHERDAWELGRVVATARARCERKDCGIEGANPDARFGRWVSSNFEETGWQTIRQARRLDEARAKATDEQNRLNSEAKFSEAIEQISPWRKASRPWCRSKETVKTSRATARP